ncbi:peptidase, partial [Escherichia coli]|nr:peptidase [Escherichia coli]
CAKRDRLGRLVAVVAKARLHDPRAVGLGVDEGAALCVEADGSAKLHAPPGGHAWLVQPRGAPRLRPGKPLDWNSVQVTGIAPDGALDLNTLQV